MRYRSQAQRCLIDMRGEARFGDRVADMMPMTATTMMVDHSLVGIGRQLIPVTIAVAHARCGSGIEASDWFQRMRNAARRDRQTYQQRNEEEQEPPHGRGA